MDNTSSIRSPKTRPRCIQACENCRRRKERCNGLQPCQRCRSRNVANACRFEQSAPTPSRHSKPSTNGRYRNIAHVTRAGATKDLLSKQTMGEPPHTTSHSISLMDSSASTVLRNVRAIAQLSIGDSEFSTSVLDPVQNAPIEKRPSLSFCGAETPISPTRNAEEALRLLDWFLYSTNGMLDLFNPEEVRAGLEAWIANSQAESRLQSAIFHLVLAIGAQTCPNGLDLTADEHFNRGRHLGLEHATAEASHASLQYFSLVGAYLMGQSLMHAAYIQIGSAVRVALLLGLHRKHATTNDDREAQMCKRIWKTVRAQDLFLSATLGQPITTRHYHDTALVADRSATANICNLLEDVLIKIYGDNPSTDDAIQSIVNHHQAFVDQFDDGLENDGLGSSEYDEHRRPHIGVCHIKHGSYANIQLLTMPSLLRRVLHRPDNTHPSTNIESTSGSSISTEFMAFGCIDAAISLVGLFRKFIDADQTPKRLPMVVYAMFYVALSLGLAIFGDLDSIFPLQDNIQIALELLCKFGQHDWLAERYATVISQMQAACKTYVQDRSRVVTGAHRTRVQQLFGSLELPKTTRRQGSTFVVSQEVGTSQTLPPSSNVLSSDQPSVNRIEQQAIDIDILTGQSFSSHHDGLLADVEVGREPSICAGSLFSSLTEDNTPYGAQLWDSVWFGEDYT